MIPTPALPGHAAVPASAIAPDRRRFLCAGLALSAAATSLGATAAGILPTPRMSEGPFYPDRLPVDRDADLTRIAGRKGRAAGEVIVLSGRVTDTRGTPLAGVRIELWQANAHGRYTHSGDGERSGPLDADFQGYASLVTDTDGRYRLTTIRPGPYPGRTPHLHFHLHPAREKTARLTTQMFFEADPGNAQDFLYRRLDAEARRAVTARIVGSTAGSAAGETQLGWDIVLPA